MSQSIHFQANPTGPRMHEQYSQSWAVASHKLAANQHELICGCFSDTSGGEQAAMDNAKFIAQMFNLREETGLTAEQIRATLMAAPQMLAAIKEAMACGMVPTSSAKEGGASRFASQVVAADMLREAVAAGERANG